MSRYNSYTNKFVFRITFVLVAFAIGVASIYFTNIIVDNIKGREEKQINLYAKTLEYTVKESNSQNLTFIYQEIILQNNSIPVILTDEFGNPFESKNIEIPENANVEERMIIYWDALKQMKMEHEPIEVVLEDNEGNLIGRNFVFYRNSKLLYQLQYYPYIQLSIITIFSLLVFLSFNYSKSAEQNRLWVGLAKETAHQLGTPLSSLMAWVEYLKGRDELTDIVPELEKDVARFEMITSRFSNIGSVPKLEPTAVVDLIRKNILYLGSRIGSKVNIIVTTSSEDIMVPINPPLFDWVIENICKNAADAMNGMGQIDIEIFQNNHRLTIDIRDNGKGIPRRKLKAVFQPGYTSKQRGWGLGLALAKRIIEYYHKGKIFVKSSELNQGTTFRIVLYA